MQRARPNVGRTSVPMSGRMATRLSSAPQPQPQSYRPTQNGALDLPGTGPKPVPAPQATRHQPASAVPRAGSRVVADVSSAGLVEAGKQTGTPAQPVQQVAPVLNNANNV